MRRRQRTLTRPLTGVICAAMIGLVGACAPDVATRGNLLTDQQVGQIDVGVSTAEEVRSRFGSPTARATFDDNIWYYIGQRTETTAFFDPEITTRRVVRIAFDETGRVASIDERTLEDGEQFAFVERETPTLGRELGLLEQLFGNLGRFNAPGAGTPNVGVPGTGL